MTNEERATVGHADAAEANRCGAAPVGARGARSEGPGAELDRVAVVSIPKIAGLLQTDRIAQSSKR